MTYGEARERFLEETAPTGYTAEGVDGTGLNRSEEQVEAVYKANDGREMRFPVDALMAGFTPDSDMGIIERSYMERPDIARLALHEGVGAETMAEHIEETHRPMTADKVREFTAVLDDPDEFLEACLSHPDRQGTYTDAEIADIAEANP
jgi:hypothetical protein